MDNVSKDEETAPSSKTIGRNPPSRLRRFDSLRGLAALVVVFNHYAVAMPDATRTAYGMHDLLDGAAWTSLPTWLRFTPLRLLVNGTAAVDLFFILSGFVLAMQANRPDPPTINSFYIRRLCRVYLPFAVVILVASAAWHLTPYEAMRSGSAWVNTSRPPPGGASLLGHLAMTGRARDMTLDVPMWTLVHEMRMSLAMPVLFLAIRKFGPLRVAVATLAASVAATVFTVGAQPGNWLATIQFAWLFAAGAALAWQRHAAKVLVSRLKSNDIVVLWGAAIALSYATVAGRWGHFPAGLGAVLAITLALRDGRASQLLETRVPLWLGRVSYSLYLIHVPILILAITWSCVEGPGAVLLGVTLLAAEITYRTVEWPAHRLGGVLANRLRGRKQGLLF